MAPVTNWGTMCIASKHGKILVKIKTSISIFFRFPLFILTYS